MLNSKFFTIMIILTLIVTAGALTLQILEMNEYSLFETLLKQFGL